MALIFNSDLIPTLPCPGGAIERDYLLGKRKPSLQVGLDSKQKLPDTNRTKPQKQQTLPVTFEVGQFVPGNNTGANATRAGARKESVPAATREEKAIRSRKIAHAATGLEGGMAGDKTTRTKRQDSAPTLARPGEPAKRELRTGPSKLSAERDTLPGRSAERVATVRGGNHSRTSSDTSLAELKRPKRHATEPQPGRSSDAQALAVTTATKHARSASLDPTTLPRRPDAKPIRLCQDSASSSPYDPVNIHLDSLIRLIPPSRGVGLSGSDSDDTPGMLDPSSLLIPFTVVLEALVYERTLLRSSAPAALPVLTDSTSLTLSYAPHELDWKVTGGYITSLGTIIDGLMPSLRDSEERDAVEDLVKQLRAYVGKSKKVFGEVAGMYVDGYGFCRGWWDETDMKAAAGEVGRWGDLFDV